MTSLNTLAGWTFVSKCDMNRHFNPLFALIRYNKVLGGWRTPEEAGPRGSIVRDTGSASIWRVGQVLQVNKASTAPPLARKAPGAPDALPVVLGRLRACAGRPWRPSSGMSVPAGAGLPARGASPEPPSMGARVPNAVSCCRFSCGARLRAQRLRVHGGCACTPAAEAAA